MKELLAWLTINRNCNLDCKWCYQRGLAKSTQSMLKRLAIELIDFLSGLPVKEIILIGGEPTLYLPLFDIISHIKKKGIRADMVSNSIRFADKLFVDQAAGVGLDSVVTSLKGSSTKEYLEATGVDVFLLVRKAIKNLEDSRINHRISVTVSRSIIANWDSMVEFTRNCGAKDFTFSFEKPTILSDRTTFDDLMMPHIVAKFVEQTMYPSLLETGVRFKIELLFPHCVLTKGFVKELEDEGHAFGGCMLMKENGIVFDTVGQVLPCNHFVTFPLGKYGVDFTTTEEFLTWRESGDRGKFYQMITSAPGERCAECERWVKCGAGCRLFWLYRGADELLPVLV